MKRRRYQRRVDLSAFQRLCRFVRWTAPDLEARDVLRILRVSQQWSTAELARHADHLERIWAKNGHTLAEAVPEAVTGEFQALGHLPGRRGRSLPREEDLSGVWLTLPGLGQVDYGPNWPRSPWERVPSLLQGLPPTVAALRELVDDLRDVLSCLVEGPEGFGHSRIADRLAGQVTLVPFCNLKQDDASPGRHELRAGYRIVGDDFGTFCYLVLFRLVSEGQVGRLGRCPIDDQFFIRVRRGGGRRRHHEFCSDVCRSKHHKMRVAARAARRRTRGS